MVRRLLRRERVVAPSSSEGGSSETPPSKKMSNEVAGPSVVPGAIGKGKRRKETAVEEGPQGIVSVANKNLAIFGSGAKRFAHPGFSFRCPDATDRICLPRPREVGFYIPCLREMGLRFPIPAFFALVLHLTGIPLYMLSANSTANMVGFLIACGLLKLPLLMGAFRYFFHIVLSEGYYVVQARRKRKLIMGLNPKVRNWKENFAFAIYPEGVELPGPPVLDLESGALSWMNDDPRDFLSESAKKAVSALENLSEDQRGFESLATSHNINRYAWDQNPMSASDLELLLNKVAAARQKESEARIAKIRKSALGARAVGIAIQSGPQARPAAPGSTPSATEHLRTSEPTPLETELAPKSPLDAPAVMEPVSPAVPLSVETLGRGIAPPQSMVAELQTSAPISSPPPSSPRGSRKRGRDEEANVAEGGENPAGYVGGSPVDSVATPADASTEAGRSQTSEGPPTSLSLIQLLNAHAEGVSKGVKLAVDSIFNEQDQSYTQSSNHARERVMDKCQKMAELCYRFKVEAEKEKKRTEGAVEKLRVARIEMRESHTAELQKRLETSEAKEKETMELLKTSNAAKDRALEELKGAQKASDAAKAELAKEKIQREAAEANLAEAHNQIAAQKGTIGLRDKRIQGLEGSLQQQAVRAQELETRAKRVAELEEQVAKAKELEATAMEQTRLKAIDDFMNREVRGMLDKAMNTGAEQGCSEGFATGFYQAIKMIGDIRPELLPELRKLSVERAKIEMDAAFAAEVQAQLEAAGGGAKGDVPGKGKKATDLA